VNNNSGRGAPNGARRLSGGEGPPLRGGRSLPYGKGKGRRPPLRGHAGAHCGAVAPEGPLGALPGPNVIPTSSINEICDKTIPLLAPWDGAGGRGPSAIL